MKIATDIGGTFTDLVSISENGHIITGKTHTTSPNFEEGVIDLIQQSKLNPKDVEMFIHGSTIVINALTERTGAKTGLITTKGFKDVLEIARGNRPDLFNLRYKKPKPFVERYLRQEVNERVDFKGNVIKELAKDDIKVIAEYFKEQKVEAVAIAYLFSFLNPAHEIETKELLQTLLPEVAITASHEVTKEWREYERTNTAVLNTYVKPTTSAYLRNLNYELNKINLSGNKYVMQSNGGTTSFSHAEEIPINVVESGPAAGVYGATILGELIGEKNIIAFDVGGTTAKCSLVENSEIKVDTNYYIEKNDKNAGYPIKVPVVDIIEIGNGGGSIAWLDKANSLKVGPTSAGAVPGPVAYGRGGKQPTITDANLLTGRLSLSNFESSIGLDAIKQSINDNIADKLSMSAEEAALGIIRMSNSNMLQALKLISIRRGYDPREFTLVAYGGGGALHASALANELGVEKIIIPKTSSVFSAWGMLMTDLRSDYIQTYNETMSYISSSIIDEKWYELETKAINEFEKQGFDKSKIFFSKHIDARYKGQEHTVKVPYPDSEWNNAIKKQLTESFHNLHEQKYTYRLEDNELEFVNLHLTVYGNIEKPELKELKIKGISESEAIKEKRKVLFEEAGWIEVNVYDRDILPAGYTISGPSVVEEQSASTVLHSNQKLEVDKYGNLIITMEEQDIHE